jgi:hypothetical protein
MTQVEMMKEIELLRSQNEALKAKVEAGKKQGTISFKVSEKSGALSVYGLGRFPVTLYREQWARLLERKDSILAFIEAHKDQLSSKEDKAA